MKESVDIFADLAALAPTDEGAEHLTRKRLSKIVLQCPLPLLVELAECVIRFRRAELKGNP